MIGETICDIDEEVVPKSEAEIDAFQTENDLVLPDLFRQILLETNGGYLRDKYLNSKENNTQADIEELFGIYEDDLDWASSIVPLPRWIEHKHQIYESYPSLEDLEKLNGSLARYFVFSASRSEFYLLDYTDSKHCKRVCHLDLVNGDRTISTLGDDLSCILPSAS